MFQLLNIQNREEKLIKNVFKFAAEFLEFNGVGKNLFYIFESDILNMEFEAVW